MYFRVIFCLVLVIACCSMLMNACRFSDNKKQDVTRKKEPVAPGRISALPEDYFSPADNPTTAEKIELGRLLFYDPILSGNKDVACASCHHPEFGYAESLPIAALLKISEGTSKSQLSKARQLLQKMINHKNEQHESRKAN